MIQIVTKMIRPIKLIDAKEISKIYNYYIKHTVITFEEQAVSIEEMKRRIRTTTADLPWLVFENHQGVAGYAYAGKWKSRSAYKHSAEVTVYLSQDQTGRGIGTALYRALIEEIGHMNYHVVIGGVALPNAASVALHEKLGFKKVAHFEEVGYKFDQWIDVAYWQRRV